ncbi:MAG: hypothetical protein H8E30_10660, partial [Alphaproteobacteria bacterium]|nr:hypothetical protein [Alphaproteobacteria bacterium]
MAAKTPDWKLDAYVDALARHGSHAQAAKVAGVGRSTAERHRKDNEEFRLLCEEAQEVYADALEREADRRAVKGVKEAVYYQGKVVGHKKNFSDVLLMFRLKGLR